MRVILAVLVFAVIATPSSVSDAQTSAGSNRVVSPTTVVYWQQHDNGDGTGSLDLLVLWRGSPGWFLRGGSTSGGGGGRGGFGQWQSTHWMTYGDVTLTVDFTSQSKDFNPATTVIKVLDREIPLRETNVVLIDGADSDRPTVVGTRYVEPRVSGADAVAAVIRRTQELFEFLRCDVTLPDANQQAMMALLCGQVRPAGDAGPPSPGSRPDSEACEASIQRIEPPGARRRGRFPEAAVCRSRWRSRWRT